MDTVILKCETQKTMNELDPKSRKVWDLLLSVATTYSYKEDRYLFWTFNQKDDLIQYLNGKCVVGFGCVNFDLPLLYGDKYHCADDYSICLKNGDVTDFKCKCYDLYFSIIMNIYNCYGYSQVKERYHKSPLPNNEAYNLKNIYVSTINNKVNFDYSNSKSIQLFKTKKILELIQFNLFKARAIKSIYDFVMKYGYVVTGTYDIVHIKKNVDV